MSQWQLYFHIVWATKHRQPLLTLELEQAVFRCALTVAAELGCEVVGLNGMPDHVHLLIRSGPQFNLSRLLKQIKGNTSALANDMHQHAASFRWQEGYYAITVTPSHVPKVQAYIKHQKEHHRAGTTYPNWEETGEAETDS